MDKSSVTKAFNAHFFKFLEDLLVILPENVEIKTAIKSFEMIKHANPTTLIKSWFIFVYSRYHNVIDEGNVSFFLDKDYSDDISSNGSKSNEILQMIDNIRVPIREMSDTNKNVAMKYVQSLSKLSELYNEFVK